jgi:Family of unknown function (DUF5367)
MILRASGLGILLWLIATAAFRFGGQYFFTPDEVGRVILFAATVPVIGVLTLALLRFLREAPGDEGEAAIALAFPGMALDAVAAYNFERVFPNLDPTLDSTFGALMLTAYATVIFTGLMTTRLAPKDERL